MAFKIISKFDMDKLSEGLSFDREVVEAFMNGGKVEMVYHRVMEGTDFVCILIRMPKDKHVSFGDGQYEYLQCSTYPLGDTIEQRTRISIGTYRNGHPRTVKITVEDDPRLESYDYKKILANRSKVAS